MFFGKQGRAWASGVKKRVAWALGIRRENKAPALFLSFHVTPEGQN